MNDDMKNTNSNGIEKKLLDVAERTHANPHFVSELESKLKERHKPKSISPWSMPLFKQTTSVVGWVALVAMLGYFLNWSFATLIPTQHPGANTTSSSFVCPVTQPNGNVPAGENPSPYFLGNDQLWTELWPDGKIYMLPSDQMSDGSFSMKWGFWRGATGSLNVEGRSLDADAAPLRADIPDGYGDTGYQVLGLIFPTTGCWEVTGRVGEASLTFVTEVVFGEATPTPVITSTQVTASTPDPNRLGFDFRGAKLLLNANLPASPGQTNLYEVIQPQPASADYAKALAEQLGITGEVYLAQGSYPNTAAFMVTDGKQQLVVNGENNFTYTSDMVTTARNYNGFMNDNAEAIIHEFLQSHGFNANFKMVDSGSLGGYMLHQLTPDGLPVEYDDTSNALRITLNENGEVLNMTAVMVKFDTAGLGMFGIISADEALQTYLNDNISAGKIETGSGPIDTQYIPPQTWYQNYPDNEPATIYGSISSSKAVDAGKPAVVFIDTVQAIGNIDGLDKLDYYTFIEATGQFVTENGVRKFNVETWNKDVKNVSVFGGARREGDQVIVNDQNGGNNMDYVLVDPPSDLPAVVNFPDSVVSVNGTVADGKLYWSIIDYYADGSNMGGGGGGGGGGLGFYPLNLSGTPVPFPTQIPIGTPYSAQELASFLKYTVKDGDTMSSIASAYNIKVDDILRANQYLNTDLQVGWTITLPGVPGPTRLDDARGTIQFTTYEKPNGTQRVVYNFFGEQDGQNYQLIGNNLETLQTYNDRPVKISGALSYDKTGTALISLEKIELLYPDLQPEPLTGTQQSTEVNANNAVLFTSAGTTYVLMSVIGQYPDYSVYNSSPEVIVEVLRVPNETYGGYPALRVLRSGPAIDPNTGKKLELPPVSDQPDVLPDPFGNADQYLQPDITIDSIELVYVTKNPAYRDSENPDAPVGQVYLQPAWHFKGHFSNGNGLDILIQALKQEYLSPNVSQ